MYRQLCAHQRRLLVPNGFDGNTFSDTFEDTTQLGRFLGIDGKTTAACIGSSHGYVSLFTASALLVWTVRAFEDKSVQEQCKKS